MELTRRQAMAGAAAGALLPLIMAGAVQAQAAQAGLLDVRAYGAIGDGMADDLPAFLAALTAAKGTRAAGVYAPAGVYRLGGLTSGRPLDFGGVAGLVLCGDGPALTTLSIDAGALTSHMRLIYLAGARQRVHGLSIAFGTGWSGAFDTSAVEITTGAYDWRVADLEISGVWGSGTAGGSGVGCYQDPGTNGGAHYGLCEDVVVRDSPRCSAFGTNARFLTFRRCRALRVGSTGNQHGFYAQGGATLFEQCVAEQCAGFSFHAHKQNQALDASGDTFRDCWSISPGLKHMIVDSYGAPPLTRYATITGCTFVGVAEGVELKVPALVEGNTFDGVYKVGSYALAASAGADGSQIGGNLFLSSGTIQAGAPCTISRNTLRGQLTGVSANAAGVRIDGNRITAAGIAGVGGAAGISVNAPNVIATNNDVTVAAPGTCIKAYGTATGFISQGNVLAATGGAWYHDVPQTLVGAMLADIRR